MATEISTYTYRTRSGRLKWQNEPQAGRIADEIMTTALAWDTMEEMRGRSTDWVYERLKEDTPSTATPLEYQQ